MSTNTRLTKKLAKALIKQETGLSGTGIQKEYIAGEKSIFVGYGLKIGKIQISVRMGTVLNRQVLSFCIFHDNRTDSIKRFYNPNTLEEDFTVESYYRRLFEKEHCEKCPFAPRADEKCSSFRTEFGKTVCYGTREREECTCGGDKTKCDFYKK